MPCGSAYLDEKGCIVEEIPAPPIRFLVFEGGGIRGVAYAGVYEEIDRAHLLDSVEHVAGSSIGAVAALLVALSYSTEEIKLLLGNLSFNKFLEGGKPWYFTPELVIKGKQYLNIISNDSHSLSSGRVFLEWLEKLVEAKLGHKHATFADLANKIELGTNNNNQAFKYLSVTGSNISKFRIEVFNHINTPNMPIATAVRISAAFPGIFKAVEWDNGQGVNLYMDGGLINNLPYFIFHERSYLRDGFDFTDKAANASVLNVKVDTAFEVAQVLWNNGAVNLIKGIKDYTMAVLDAMQSRDTEIYEQYATNIIQIYDHGVDTLHFDVNVHARALLMRSGREATLDWLQNHVSEAYEIRYYRNEAHCSAEAAWLNSKSMEEVAAIRNGYSNMLKQQVTEAEQDSIQDKIFWLEKYLFWRTRKLIAPDNSEKIEYTPHVDLKMRSLRFDIDRHIKKDMYGLLDLIHKQITLLKTRIAENKLKIDSHVAQRLHDLMIIDLVVYVAKLKERLKLNYLTYTELLTKLNLPCSEFHAQPVGKRANNFREMIQAYLLEKKYSLHREFLLTINHFLNTKLASCPHEDDTIPICLNLQDLDDYKLFILSCMLYLSFICCEETIADKVRKHYAKLFGTDEIPKNLSELGTLLGMNKSDLLISAYRIEKFIKYYIALDRPKEKDKFSLIKIDDVFMALGAEKKRAFEKIFEKKQIKGEDEVDVIEMDFLYNTYGCTDKFMMFHKLNEQNNFAFEDIEREKLKF